MEHPRELGHGQDCRKSLLDDFNLHAGYTSTVGHTSESSVSSAGIPEVRVQHHDFSNCSGNPINIGALMIIMIRIGFRGPLN